MSEGLTFATKEENRLYLDEPAQPAPGARLIRLRSRPSQLVAGVRQFAPILPKDDAPVQILGIAVSPTPEEASMLELTQRGNEIAQNPRLLKGPLHQLVMDNLGRWPNIKADNYAHASLVPWLLPKNRRFRPNKEEVAIGAPLIHELITEIKPQMILAYGKVVFDELVDYKISADDARGGWFSYKDTGIPVYLCDPLYVLVTKPWTLEEFMTDCRQVNMMLGAEKDRSEDRSTWDHRVISTEQQLVALVDHWRQKGIKKFAVDCEWRGTQFIDGDLRSIQFCWGKGKAAYLRFFDQDNNRYLCALENSGTVEAPFHPDKMIGPREVYTDFRRVGEILQAWLNQPDIRFIGHHASADSPWMERWLGIDVYGKFEMDTEFASQCVNEYAPAGLDYLALRHTPFGRYDLPLVFWKKENKVAKDEGYGRIPDDIIIPYALLDVEVTWRAAEAIWKELEIQDLDGYYRGFINPFTTEVFHDFVTVGLPVDMELFDLVRKFMNWAYRVLNEDLMQFIAAQCNEVIAKFLDVPVGKIESLAQDRDEGRGAETTEKLRQMGRHHENQFRLEKLLLHWNNVRGFNIRSVDHMRLWLFDVLELMPVKSTKGGDSGIPQMLWEKILELPPKLQALAKPSTDKESLEIIQERDDTGSVRRLLAVSNVGNQCKGFLKEGDVDENGEVVEENGLAKFISPTTLRIHPNLSLTETSRSRSWKPNVLNLSSYHNKGVENGILRLLDSVGVPDEFASIFGPEEDRVGLSTSDLIKKRMPTVRSVVSAPPGWCIVESDYNTAEIRGLAFISGDSKLINLVIGHDPAFAKFGKKQVRLYYPNDAGIDPALMDPALLMTIKTEEGLVKVDPAKLERRPNGCLAHPPYDLHWLLAERAYGKPREIMDEKIDRGAAKVAGFASVYGAVASTLDRRIEAVTGIKPPEGTGETLLEAIAARQPVATDLLDEVATRPKTGKQLRAASGRIRHFPVHSQELIGMPWRVRNSYLRSMGNEARNFLMQESVAATSARACLHINRFYRRMGMRARANISLYDAITSLCPLEERFICSAVHDVFMDRVNLWNYHGRWMSYTIETDLVFRWSWKPSQREKDMLYSTEFKAMDVERSNDLMGALQKVEDDFFALLPGVKERVNKL